MSDNAFATSQPAESRPEGRSESAGLEDGLVLEEIGDVRRLIESVCSRVRALHLGAPGMPARDLVEAVLGRPEVHVQLIRRLAEISDENLAAAISEIGRELADRMPDEHDGYPPLDEGAPATDSLPPWVRRAEAEAEAEAVAAAADSEEADEASFTDPDDLLSDEEMEDALHEDDDADHDARNSAREAIRDGGPLPDWVEAALACVQEDSGLEREYEQMLDAASDEESSDDDAPMLRARLLEACEELDELEAGQASAAAAAGASDTAAERPAKRPRYGDAEVDAMSEGELEYALDDVEGEIERISAPAEAMALKIESAVSRCARLVADAGGAISDDVSNARADGPAAALLGYSDPDVWPYGEEPNIASSPNGPFLSDWDSRRAWPSDGSEWLRSLPEGEAPPLLAHIERVIDTVVDTAPEPGALKRKRTEYEAIGEIFEEQRKSDLIIDARIFADVVKTIASDCLPAYSSEPCTFAPDALEALQVAAEEHCIEVLAEANRLAIHAGRTFVDGRDIGAARPAGRR